MAVILESTIVGKSELSDRISTSRTLEVFPRLERFRPMRDSEYVSLQNYQIGYHICHLRPINVRPWILGFHTTSPLGVLIGKYVIGARNTSISRDLITF
jgi:hypothetical protein